MYREEILPMTHLQSRCRTYVIGDIHGCYFEFRDLLEKLGPSSGSQVLCLGDFMDKGPYGPECVKFARENGIRSVMGNHDLWHVRWYRNERLRELEGRPNGMTYRERRAAENKRLSEEDYIWLRGLPSIAPYMGGYAVHAGFEPGIHPLDQNLEKVPHLCWVDQATKKPRSVEPFAPPPAGAVQWFDLWDMPYDVVFGHVTFSLTEPFERVHLSFDREHLSGLEYFEQEYLSGLKYRCRGIDTGAVYGGRLTAFDTQTREYVQVKARKEYAEMPTWIPWLLKTRERFLELSA